MANVSFDEESQIKNRSYASTSSSTGLAGYLVRLGLAKDTRSAERIALALALLLIVVAIGVFIHSTVKPVPPPLLPIPGSTPAQ